MATEPATYATLHDYLLWLKANASTYQLDFFRWVLKGAGSVVLEAGPGSGKTWTIEHALPLIPETNGRGYPTSAQCFAFNSTIGAELKARVDALKARHSRAFAGFRAGTFHSVGFGAVCKHLGKRPSEVKTDAGKCRTICREWLGETDYGLYADFICKLVGFAKGQGVGCLEPDTDDAWYSMIHHHDLMLDSEDATEERAVDLARQLLRISNERAKGGTIDFDDQLYLVLLWKLRLWQNDWVFVDESQDTNPVRRAIAKLALRPGGRLVAVGDPRQAIYGVTGASADAMDLIRAEFNAQKMPLTVCYRCSAAVVEAVALVYPGCIEEAPGAKAGKVSNMLEADEALKLLTKDDAILCRNTAPLVSLAYAIMASGRGCRILGRDIGEGLIKLVEKMRARTIDGLVEKLGKYREREVGAHLAKGEEGKAEAVNDRCDCIDTIIANLDENSRTLPALKEKISGMFRDGNEDVLTLCTIHRSKGKEWPQVGIYRPELMPSKWARQEHQQVQERNLDWVARSRAMEHLMWIAELAAKKQRREEKKAAKLEEVL